MVLVRSGKHVVRHIGVNIGIVLFPFHIGGNTVDIAHELLLEVDSGVRIALHTAFATVPGPSCVPRSTRAREAVNVDALGASPRILAPEVVVHCVRRA